MKNIKNNVKSWAFFFANFSFVVYLIWVIFPLLNTLYTYDVNGTIVDMVYGIPWALVFILAINIVLPIILLLTLIMPGTTPFCDMHYLLSLLLLIVNTLIALGFLGFWFFGFSALSFNDYRWCCVNAGEYPEYCANIPLIPCSPTVTPADLDFNWEFYLHWIWCGVFFIIALGHYATNYNLRKYNVIHKDGRSKKSGMAFGTTVVLLSLGAYLYWVALPLLNTLYVYGYPLIHIAPSPGSFVSTLYSYQWVMILFMTFNIFPGLLLMFVMLTKKGFTFFYWTTVIVMTLTLITTLVFCGMFIFDCNWPNYSWLSWLQWLRNLLGSLPIGESLCNDYKWCCKHFAEAPSLCANVTPCIPEVTNLNASGEFVQHIIFSIWFGIMDYALIWTGWRLKRYGVVNV